MPFGLAGHSSITLGTPSLDSIHLTPLLFCCALTGYVLFNSNWWSSTWIGTPIYQFMLHTLVLLPSSGMGSPPLWPMLCNYRPPFAVWICSFLFHFMLPHCQLWTSTFPHLTPHLRTPLRLLVALNYTGTDHIAIRTTSWFAASCHHLTCMLDITNQAKWYFTWISPSHWLKIISRGEIHHGQENLWCNHNRHILTLFPLCYGCFRWILTAYQVFWPLERSYENVMRV